MQKPVHLFHDHLKKGEFSEALAVFEANELLGFDSWMNQITGYSPFVYSLDDLFDEAVRQSIFSCNLFDAMERSVFMRSNYERVDAVTRKTLAEVLDHYYENREPDRYIFSSDFERVKLDNQGLRLWTIARYLHKHFFDGKPVVVPSDSGSREVQPDVEISLINRIFESELRKHTEYTMMVAINEARQLKLYSHLHDLSSERASLHLAVKGYVGSNPDF